MGSGPNVNLVFKPALNVVYCSWPLLFCCCCSTVVQARMAKMGCSGQNFCLRRLWRRTISKSKCRFANFYGWIRDRSHPLESVLVIFDHWSFSTRFGEEPSKLGSFGVCEGLTWPCCCSEELTVVLLLFRDLTVVLVQLLFK